VKSEARVTQGLAHNRRDVVYRCENGNLNCLYANDGVNFAHVALHSGGDVDGSPCPVTTSASRVDIFWKHKHNRSLQDTWFNGAAWETSQLSAGPVHGSPSAFSHGGRFDCIFRGPGKTLQDTWWNGSEWVTSQLSEGPVEGSPHCVYGICNNPSRIDVFWKHKHNNNLMDSWWNGSAWVTNELSQVHMKSAPSALVSENGRIDVFYQGPDGSLQDTWYNGSSWVTSELYNGQEHGGLDSRPVGIAGFSPGRIDAFWRGHDGKLMDTYWNGSAWGTACLSHQGCAGVPSPIVGNEKDGHAGKFHVYYKGHDGHTWCTEWNGSAWVQSKAY